MIISKPKKLYHIILLMIFNKCRHFEQPRGKDTPGYQDLIFYDQYLRRYEQINEKWCKFPLKLTFCVESGGHIQNSPKTFHFVPFGMPIERFWH